MMKNNDLAATNMRWALTLIDGLASAGVVHAVISPGSRSTPLALACTHHPGVTTHVVLDERSAAFFALGLAKADNRPVALVGTSGSAPANWFPAVIEANYGAVPLILLSADRPPELRECGANQTVDQARLFGGHVRFAFDLGVAESSLAALRHVAQRARQAVDESRWPMPGPVHLNVPLREPLTPTMLPEFAGAWANAPAIYPRLMPPGHAVARLAGELSGQPGVIVCGAAVYPDAFPAAVAALAAKLDCPLLADPLSNLRFGSHDRSRVLTRYDAFLRNRDFAAGHRPAWVLRFGALPVSKSLQQYLAAQDAARHILVEPHGRWPDPLHLSNDLFHADAAALCEALLGMECNAAAPVWMADFIQQEKRAADCAAPLPMEAEIVRVLLNCLPADALLFSGNSMPIRDLDSFSGSAEKPLRIVANRGASGIDGNVSTALGMAQSGTRKVVALLGDLACCHDSGGLLAARGLEVTLVVLNNGGGGIFGYLPQAGLASFERLWLTPAGLDFERMALLYGLAFRRVAEVQDFEEALTLALTQPGAKLIEVRVNREESLFCHRSYWAALEQ
ncbi:MAG: 2-succinyl-5-enolpyruvyl-6-hydroxy-3-cyclohexene-1-carboxylic-acid synthase [Sulfuricellaceae bacterium]